MSLSLPCSQTDVREYYGEKIALFYAWFGLYTYSLIFLAVVGFAVELLYVTRGNRESALSVQIVQVLFLTFVTVWMAVGKEYWEREENAIALKWGTKGFVEDEKNRPRYRCDPNEPFRRSVITNRMEVYFPENKRKLMQGTSFFVLLLIIALVVFMIGCLFYLEWYLHKQFRSEWVTYFISFLLALQIRVHSYYSNNIITMLNEWENHRTETSFENNLIFKTFQFELFNHYGALFFIAFLKGNIFHKCYIQSNCLYDLRVLLYFIFIIRFIILFYGLISMVIMAWNETEFWDGGASTNPLHHKSLNDEEAELLSSMESDKHFLDEINRLPPHGTLFKFARTVLQYGYLTLFITAQPALGVLALIENLIQMRLDAWHLCTVYRRHHVVIAENVGFWRTLMSSMGTLAVICNVGIICFTAKTLNNYNVAQRWLVFLIVEQILILIKFLVHRSIDTYPQYLKDIHQRQKYIAGKFMHGLEDADEADTEIMNIKGHLDDADDPTTGGKDGQTTITVKDISRQDAKIGESNYSRLEELEATRRDLLRDLRLIKEQLQAVSKTEVYNPQTGIGETKHGLPLGRLTIRLVEMQNLIDELKDQKMVIKVRVYLQGYRRDNKIIITSKGDSLLSQTASYPLSSQTIAFNQSLGPFAPINTLDADVVFDVIDTSPDANEAVVASAAVKLRDLTDQQQHDKVLHLRTRTATGELELSKASKSKLFVQLQFMYSNIVPLKTRIYHVQDKLRQIDKEVASLKAGM